LQHFGFVVALAKSAKSSVDFRVQVSGQMPPNKIIQRGLFVFAAFWFGAQIGGS